MWIPAKSWTSIPSWLSDRIVSPLMNMEPVVALSFAAARTKNLKFGTSVLALPLRNPTILAKELATLDFLSGGRSLPAVGLGTEDANEYEACGTTRNRRVSRTEEAIQVMRPALAGRRCNLSRQALHTEQCHRAPQARVSAGRHAAQYGLAAEANPRSDAPPASATAGWCRRRRRRKSKSASTRYSTWADEYDNDIEEDHYGALTSFCIADTAEEAERIAAPYMLRRREDTHWREFSSFGKPEAVRALIDEYIAAGAQKFVMRPACPPEMMQQQLEILGREIVPRYHTTATHAEVKVYA